MNQLVPMELGLCCRDLDLLKRFYCDALGLTEINDLTVPAEKAGQTGLSEGGYRVARLQTPQGERLKLLQPHTPPEPAAREHPILARQGTSYLTLIVDDLAAALDRLRSYGASLLSGDAPVEVRPGTFLVFATDPEGNVIECVQYADIQGYRPDIRWED